LDGEKKLEKVIYSIPGYILQGVQDAEFERI
jgi:hypothetical protein